MPTTVVSTTLVRPLDWPAAALECGDSVDVVAQLKEGLAGAPADVLPPHHRSDRAGPDLPGATDLDLELLESRTSDGCMQELISRSALHSA